MFNLVGGLWPLLHRRSFEAVFGPKNDRWLQYTVAGLLAGNGVAQIMATLSPAGVVHARRVGIITAAWLLAIDLTYVPKGDIPKTYLLDAVMEVGWLSAWSHPVLRARGPGLIPTCFRVVGAVGQPVIYFGFGSRFSGTSRAPGR
ncbi:hypothetical protein [Nocardia sp. CY41]|uniref:hypothetical protein n=1 Tax=Nocardia sp. CY41 TaxID=2608686 RepID=UPI001915342F|nr:hypothetical protein [Nocardia sp. CY41]